MLRKTVKTNTVHSLLDYGDYDKMKEFSMFFMHIVPSITTTNMPSKRRCNKNNNRKEKYHNILLIQLSVIKYPDDIYANDLITSSQVVTFEMLHFLKISINFIFYDLLFSFFFSLSSSRLLALASLANEFSVLPWKTIFTRKKICTWTKIDIVALKNYNFCTLTKSDGLLNTWTFSTDWVFLIMLEYHI